MKVLIVEDDPDQALLACDALESTEYEPTVVHTAADCRALDLQQFGVIMLDYQLPDGVGLNLLTEIRPQTDVPIIMVTGEHGLAVEAIKRGASDYIVKTRDYLQTLLLAIEKNIEQYRLRQQKAQLEEDLQRTICELQLKNEQLQMAHDHLIEAAKLSAVAQLVSGVAHEINNPLTGIIGFAELLQQNVTDETTRSLLRTVHNLALRCASTIKALATFARQGKLPKGLLSVNELLRSCLTLNEHSLTKNDIAVDLQLCEPIHSVQAHAGQLQQVFINIIKNSQQALSHVQRKRHLLIETGHRDGMVFIRIKDNGHGMDADAQSHAFEPFFTTQQVGEGSGLGLSVTYGIIKEHGGDILMDSAIEEGTEVTILLPDASRLKTGSVVINEMIGNSPTNEATQRL
ncbi:MAG TPA: ATP-binding protein [Blastocatellia bacterium]|nr:ATP-binding protein [Blastocatellia bacterium]